MFIDYNVLLFLLEKREGKYFSFWKYKNMLGYRWLYVLYLNVFDNESFIMKKVEELMRLGYMYEVFIR